MSFNKQDKKEKAEGAHSLLQCTSDEVRAYLLSTKSYCLFDLPGYFDFTAVLNCAGDLVNTGEPCQYRHKERKVRAFDQVNHLVLDNKDGAYEWRPMQLVHPVLYAELVSLITEPQNWKDLLDRFRNFQTNSKIKCQSIPSVGGKDSQKGSDISRWVNDFEQESVRLSLDFKYVACTDIVDCYGALYTHSVAWAIHTKEKAKESRYEENLGNKIDRLLQDIHSGQTNGIPQGNAVSNLIAEILLGYADLKLGERLQRMGVKEYQILRYRDDYRIFTNSKEDGHLILRELMEVLHGLNFKLSGVKTQLSDDVVGASMKEDKMFWIQNIRLPRSAFETLLIIRGFGRRFPNSGSLVKALTNFRRRIESWSNRPSNNAVLISIVIDIMYHNPRAYPQSASILSKLLSFENSCEQKDYIARIRHKFCAVPNKGFLYIWMQRISLSIDPDLDYCEPLCKAVVAREPIPLWGCEWLKEESKKCVESVSIVNREKLTNLDPLITLEETEAFSVGYENGSKVRFEENEG